MIPCGYCYRDFEKSHYYFVFVFVLLEIRPFFFQRGGIFYNVPVTMYLHSCVNSCAGLMYHPSPTSR